MKNLGHLLVTILFILGFSDAQAQIKGTIIDQETNEPLIGASIVIKGTDNGTITEFDGTFSLDAKQGDVLIISYTGYTTKEIAVDERTSYEIILSSGIDLEDVVIVGSRGKARTDVDRPVPC